MDFGKILKTIRIQRCLTQKELGQMVGVSEVTVGNWERGVKLPNLDTFIAIGSALQTSLDILANTSFTNSYQASIEPSNISLLNKYNELDSYGQHAVKSICNIEYERVIREKEKLFKGRTKCIPLYSTPSAAGPSVPLDSDMFEMIAVDQHTPSSADFAVKIQGKSMLPYIEDGSIVFVNRNADLRNGDIGIFCVDGSMYCKQLHIDDKNNITLLSCNKNYKHTNIYIDAGSSSTFQVYGKVIVGNIPYPDYFIV